MRSQAIILPYTNTQSRHCFSRVCFVFQWASLTTAASGHLSYTFTYRNTPCKVLWNKPAFTHLCSEQGNDVSGHILAMSNHVDSLWDSAPLPVNRDAHTQTHASPISHTLLEESPPPSSHWVESQPRCSKLKQTYTHSWKQVFVLVLTSSMSLK